MSEYPDKVLLDALDEAASNESKWPFRGLTKYLKSRNFGDLTMIFSLENGGIPVLSSVYIPWLLVWESLVRRMERYCRVHVGADNRAFDSGEDDSPQVGLTLQDLDDAIDRVTSSNGYDRPIITVDCGPGLEYTLQLLVCYGGLSGIVKSRQVDLSNKYELGWTLTEASMISQYVAARVGIPADRLVFAACNCYVPRNATLGRKHIGIAAYMRQPNLCFGRVAKSARDCESGDIFVTGYMRASRSVCNINGVLACSDNSIRRAMSLGAASMAAKWKIGSGSSRKVDGDQQVAVYF